MTETEICNLALSRIGVTEYIDSLDEDSAHAQACSVIFDIARDTALASASWSFATKRATLALLDVEHDEWEYVYTLPADLLEVQSFWPATPKTPYGIELNSGGTARVIVTNAQDAVLIYTKRVTNTGLFTAQFCDALAWRLAVDLALSISKNPQMSGAAQQAYVMALSVASAASANGSFEEQADSEFITIRG